MASYRGTRTVVHLKRDKARLSVRNKVTLTENATQFEIKETSEGGGRGDRRFERYERRVSLYYG